MDSFPGRVCFPGICWKKSHRKTNMSPENQWLEDIFPIEIYNPFLGDMLVFREGTCLGTIQLISLPVGTFESLKMIFFHELVTAGFLPSTVCYLL